MSSASWQCALQNSPNASSVTMQLQAGCAHFFGASIAFLLGVSDV
jgi:hypothetical protein